MENRKENEEAPSKETEIGVWIIICLIELRESRLLRLASGSEDGGSRAGEFLMELVRQRRSVGALRDCFRLVKLTGFEPSAFKQTEVLAGLGWRLKDRNRNQRNNCWTRIGHSLRLWPMREQIARSDRTNVLTRALTHEGVIDGLQQEVQILQT